MNDSTYTAHLDTNINGHHVIIDTTYKRDTIIIEKTCFEEELKIIERLIDRPDFGKSFASVLIMIFAIYTLYRKWKKKS